MSVEKQPFSGFLHSTRKGKKQEANSSCTPAWQIPGAPLRGCSLWAPTFPRPSLPVQIKGGPVSMWAKCSHDHRTIQIIRAPKCLLGGQAGRKTALVWIECLYAPTYTHHTTNSYVENLISKMILEDGGLWELSHEGRDFIDRFSASYKTMES